jgi:environmental stress-induced protein Ves
VRIVRRADHRVVPWKNGRGSTTEIAIWPPGSTVAGGFDWRVSMAAVTEDGPFSAFPGIDRTLVLLDEGGLDLVGLDGTISLRERYAIARFDGGAPISGRLRGGPVRDLNVMVRRDAFAHDADVVRLSGVRSVGPGAPLLVITLDESVRVDGEALAEGELAIGERLTIEGDGTVLVAKLTPR